MVLGRNDKRKRKEGDLVDLVDPLSESPKRTKVHAQRKFAQGAATVFSSAPPLVKEKEKAKPAMISELITHKRPNTEDFLTFLCFRGTSILPPSLNFFNMGAKKDKGESKSSSSKTPVKSSSASTAGSSTSTGKGDSSSGVQSKATTKNSTPVKKKIVPNGVNKTLNKYKTTNTTVQALKKKYQEQRLAKQRIKNKFKTTCVMRTRSSTERPVHKSLTKLPPRKFVRRNENKRRDGLRSSSFLDKAKKPSVPAKVAKTIAPKTKKRLNAKERSSESEESVSGSSDEEDEDDDEEDEEEETVRRKNSQQLRRTATANKTVKKKICTRSKSEVRRITRSQRESSQTTKQQVASVSRRPTRKTKEAAAVYMEILGRKLVSPDLENEDNVSLDSFPELPNARRTAAAENEIKAKSKVAKGKDSKEKETKNENEKSNKTKAQPEKAVLKSKRTLGVRRYCELDSEDESETSVEPEKPRQLTRRNVTKVEKTSPRSLRSSSRNQPTKPEKVLKNTKEKEKAKRPRIAAKKPETEEESEEEEEQKETKTVSKVTAKKTETKIEKSGSKDSTRSTETKPQAPPQKNRPEEKTVPTSQVSDDEESFRGFTKKAISKVLNSCSSHASANLLASSEICSLELKSQETQKTPTPSKVPIKVTEKPKREDSPSSKFPEEKPIPKVESEQTDEKTTINLMEMPGVGSRKARVNMSTEQIEKWLNESSMAREKSKTESETGTSFHTDVKIKPEGGHLSIPTRIQHLVRPVNVTIPKLMEKSTRSVEIQKKTALALSQTRSLIANALNASTPNRNKINADIKEIIKGRNVKTREASVGEETDSIVSKSDQNSVDGSVDKKSTPEKKTLPTQQRKTFLPKVKERKTTQPSANAFSPDNESSVYAFESDTETPVNTPFRRKLKEQSDTSKTSPESEASRTETASKFKEAASETEKKNVYNVTTESSEKMVIKSLSTLSKLEVLPLSRMSKEWINCHTSIAVQVNLDESRDSNAQNEKSKQEQRQEKLGREVSSGSQEKEDQAGHQKCTEISTQTENTNENETDGHVFYIPLQTVGRNGPNLVQGQQLIQGVAVKLGTEGPNGPNQRVLLRAQLVTKAPVTVARCPPVGTVQPTTRNPPSSSTSVLDHPYAVVDSVASTSSEPVPQTIEPVSSQTRSAPSPANSGVTKLGEKNTKSPKAARERKASLDSTKTGKRVNVKSKQKASELVMTPSNAIFPPCQSNLNTEARLLEAPTFHPTEKDFQDPLEYIDKIRSIAEKFGICRVVPPANFKPECKVSDDMRFTAYNQYVHRMLHRWGPNVKEMMAIKKYLATQSITLTHPPWIGGMEVDLPHLYQTVQSLGGLKEVIEKKKWQKVADGMKIPKSAQDRVTKLDDIYCKYLLPYDTLSPEERGKLFDDVEEDWKKRETKTLQRLDSQSVDNDEEEDDDSSDEIEECIIKGRNMPLNAFYRIARNTQRMWFGENQRSGSETEGASAVEVEAAFWKHVAERKRHVCVHAASIDSSGRGFGFSVVKNSPFARHPWNLKVLTNNAGSVLRALGPLMGVTVPTLHVGMLFSACCWYRDPHGLPWIEYLHTGAKKIWYGIPDEHNNNFREALSKMVPRYCKKKTIWLPSDTAMVPPELLVNNGVPLCRIVQEPGQFIVVFPKAFTSSICTGYVVSESVYFAQPAWLENAEQVFKDLQDSCEPSIFSFERLLFSIINDSRSQYDVLKQIMPVVIKIRDRELEYRRQLEYIGLADKKKLPLPGTGKGKKGKKVKEEDGDFECETCRANLFVSLVNNTQDDSMYCLPHALQLIVRKKQVIKHCTLMYTYTEDELDDLIHKLEDRIEAKSKKTNQIRQSK